MSKGSYLGGGEVSWPPGASTRTRLYELGHKRYGHEPGRYTPRQYAGHEIDAEVFAWERMGKKPTPRVALPAIGALREDSDLSDDEILSIVVKVLRSKGINVSRADREDLEAFVREFSWGRRE